MPREDAVDENARRMADVAVKGFKSPWFAGLKDLFPPEVLSAGEMAIRKTAAQMVRDHQEGLSTMLYDADAAAQKVIEQLQGKQNMDDFIATVREKVKLLGKDVKDLDIAKALGVELPEEEPAAAGKASAQSKTIDFEQIKAQMLAMAKGESPLVGLIAPKPEDTVKITKSATAAATTTGDAMVTQMTEGKYGEKSITAISTQMKAKEEDLKASGVQLADWMGGALLTRFSTTVPPGILDILVDHLEDRLDKAAADKAERTSGATTTK